MCGAACNVALISSLQNQADPVKFSPALAAQTTARSRRSGALCPKWSRHDLHSSGCISNQPGSARHSWRRQGEILKDPFGGSQVLLRGVHRPVPADTAPGIGGHPTKDGGHGILRDPLAFVDRCARANGVKGVAILLNGRIDRRALVGERCFTADPGRPEIQGEFARSPTMRISLRPLSPSICVPDV